MPYYVLHFIILNHVMLMILSLLYCIVLYCISYTIFKWCCKANKRLQMFLEEVKARSNEVCGEPLGLGYRV